MKPKHRKDQNHGKSGRVGGNPRYAGKGFQKGDRAKKRTDVKKHIHTASEGIPNR
jgi:hypothetical protein